jgi:hypothetical protein
MEALHHFQEDQHHHGGEVFVTGFDNFKALSSHPLATRKYDPTALSRYEIRLDSRQVALRQFASETGYAFYPQVVRTALKYKDFPISKGSRILHEENTLEKYLDEARIIVADVTLAEGARQEQSETKITLALVSETGLKFPDFALEPEGLWTKLSELGGSKDIDFSDHPEFSKKYFLRGENEVAIREFYSAEILNFLENREEIHIESHRGKLLFYKKRALLDVDDIPFLEKYAEDFLAVAQRSTPGAGLAMDVSAIAR